MSSPVPPTIVTSTELSPQMESLAGVPKRLGPDPLAEYHAVELPL
ncbi:hypothetical protein N183_33930 [Sinorhizobium sp. Sb3]|nr:hypothetical protein N183_33930 [Sinorhizobium sp. Sb3]